MCRQIRSLRQSTACLTVAVGKLQYFSQNRSVLRKFCVPQTQV